MSRKSITEEEIRPKELFNKYLELSKQDGDKLSHDKFEEISCPACDSTKTKNGFLKNSYKFEECSNCNTLYCSPRPSEKQLDSLYFNSESSTFWSNIFFPKVSEARREKLFKPKANKIVNFIKDKRLNVESICDVGAGHGIMLQEIKAVDNNFKLFAIEPDKDSAKVCRENGIEVLQTISREAKEWESKFDFVMSNEVIEHVFSPLEFITSLCNLTKKDGYALITGLGYEGFDILSLQENSNSVSAPHHLNFMSIEGFKKLFTRAGFSEVEVWTPGQLDVNIVLNSNSVNHFTEALARRGDDALEEFQKFLVKHNLSSHIWVLAKK